MAPIFPGLARPLLFAHRGASLYAPENTWEAFELGLMSGADVLEMDVHCTRDGEVVVIHDADVKRTTNGTGLVSELSMVELSRLDAGYHFLRRGEHPFRGRGAVVSPLREILAAFPQAGFNIEVKQKSPSMVARVLAVLEQTGVSQVVLTAADHDIMRELEAARPGVGLGLSEEQAWRVMRGRLWGGVPSEFQGRALQMPPRLHGVPLVTGRFVKALEQAQVELHLWVINGAREAAHWLTLGARGIMSDDPAAMSEVFAGFRGDLRTSQGALTR